MQLNELKPKSFVRKDQKRVGRGGKRGTTSGHGTKGQKSRAGHRIRPAERDLLMRIPKLRGVKNLRKSPEAIVFSVADLSKMFAGAVVTKAMLLEKGLVKSIRDRVKVLANGEAKAAFSVEGLQVSKTAKAKIEKAGGSVK